MKKILSILMLLAVIATPKLAGSAPTPLSCVDWDDISISGERYVCPNSGYYTYTAINTSNVPILEYHWEVPTGFTIISQVNNSVTVSTGNDVDIQTLEVYVRTECEWQGQWFFTVGERGSCF